MSSDASTARPAAVTSEEFRKACGRFATGITIATAFDSEGAPHGLTVNSFTSVSLDPPLISICLGYAVTLLPLFQAITSFGINILAENQQPLSDRFARRGHDRFDGVLWHRGEHGVPLIEGVLAELECTVEQRIPAGDHEILLGRVVATKISEGEPLLYFASRYRQILTV